jgi:hypothetical protein
VKLGNVPMNAPLLTAVPNSRVEATKRPTLHSPEVKSDFIIISEIIVFGVIFIK